MYTYNDFAKFYDLEYSHKQDDIPLYLDCAIKYGSPILEIGVGTGRVAIPLAKAGFEIVGIDSSIEMLKIRQAKLREISNKVRSRIHLIAQDMRCFSFRHSFPLCIVPFRTFLHNLTMDDQVRTLKCIYDSLLPNGIIILEVFVPLYSLLAQSEWEEEMGEENLDDNGSILSLKVKVNHKVVPQLLHIRNIYTEKFPDNRTEYTVREMTYRYVFRYEMELLLQRVGFTVNHVYGTFDKNPYNYFSGEMIIVGKRN